MATPLGSVVYVFDTARRFAAPYACLTQGLGPSSQTSLTPLGQPVLLVFAGFLKLLQDMLAFSQPWLLKQLLVFIASFATSGSGSDAASDSDSAPEADVGDGSSGSEADSEEDGSGSDGARRTVAPKPKRRKSSGKAGAGGRAAAKKLTKISLDSDAEDDGPAAAADGDTDAEAASDASEPGAARRVAAGAPLQPPPVINPCQFYACHSSFDDTSHFLRMRTGLTDLQSLK